MSEAAVDGKALVERLKAERAEKLKAANAKAAVNGEPLPKRPVRTESKIIVPNFGKPILPIVPTLKDRAKAEEAERKAHGAKPKEDRRSIKPVIEMGRVKDSPHVGRNVEAAIAHLVDRGVPIFRRAGRLVESITETGFDSENNPVTFSSLIELNEGSLKMILMEEMKWTRQSEKGGAYEVNPGSEIGRLILSTRSKWRFPEVSGVINAPTLRPDGSLLNKEGYDAATGMLLSNAPAVSINPKPTRADAEAALELLKGLLVEMPFVGEADRSVALSLIISLVLRAALETPPLHAYASPHSGAGKSFIVNISSMIASGGKCAVMGATRIGEELEKKINSALLAGRALISLDNFNGVLSSGLLCQALTEPVVMVRPLGRSTEVPIASRFVFAATGNNLQITDDLDRRVLLAKLDVKMGRPFERQFKQRPLEMIAQERARYIAAALTIPLAYIAAGYPDLPPELNSFTRWSKLVRGPLMWLDEADPVLTLLAAIESDPKVQASAAMLVALRDAFGLGPGAKRTKQEIIDAIDPREVGTFQSILGAPIERPAKQKALREALMGLEVEEGNDLSTKLTYWLRANNDRSISGLRLRSEFDKHSKVNKWYVELATE